MSKLNENYKKLLQGAAEKNFQNNLKNIDNMTKEQIYEVAYLNGYEACFDIYHLSMDDHPPV